MNTSSSPTEPSAPAPAKSERLTLSSERLRELRARAHSLEPVVHVGHGGVSEPVLRAIRSALTAHELIKVRLHEPEDKRGMAEQIAQATRAALCGLVGHTVILFRPKPKKRAVSGVARTSIKRNQPKPRGRKNT